MKPRVLIVDDSLTVRMDLADAFAAGGFAATPCATATEARTAMTIAHVDLLVVDVLLPDADGIELVRELRASGAVMPIMMLSSEINARDRARGLHGGADDYIGKPYDTAFVIARAHELLRRRPKGRSQDERVATVLVIDDSPTFRHELSTALERAGYGVVTAASGEDGLRVASAAQPAAMIVDGILPGIDGTTVIRRARLDAALRSTPCLLLTASDSHDDELRALESGADAYMRKDEDLALILTRLAAVLRKRQTSVIAADTSSALSPKRILTVDDSETYLQLVSSQLRAEGYDVLVARSGEEALELLAVQLVDCIVLDLVMPGLSGRETCRRIKETIALREIPIVILTALEERDAMIESINAGADDYIPKSSDFAVLTARLRAQLRRTQFEDENRRIRDELQRKEVEARETRAARDLAEARAVLLADLERKNEELAGTNLELERAREIAQRESRFKSRFLASMSHELRTPLNAIIGFSELLERKSYGQLNDTQLEYIRHVSQSGRHLLTLINDILDLSKVEAGRAELHQEWTALPTVVAAVQGVIWPLSEKQGVTVSFELEPDLPALYVDPVRLKQVLYNLLSNAIKFTAAGGRVWLSARLQDAHVEIAVGDTGVGISSEDLPRLFNEFEQLEPSSTGKPEGTGLGLALSKRFIEMHGGTIRVESRPGVGSTFTVELPALGGREGSLVPLEGAGAAETVVLVIEDDSKAATLISSHLHAAGLGVAFATNGEEAMRLAVELRPAAITLDILMPRTDGWAVLANLKRTAATASIPVVVISVVDQPNRGLILGATDYLAKPISRDSLLASLGALGLPLHRVDGLRVIVSGHGNGALDEIGAHLRQAGCTVQRADRLIPDLLAQVHADLVLVDIGDDPASAVQQLDLALGHAIPALGIIGDAIEETVPWRPHLTAVSEAEALRADRLVRAVRTAVDRGRRSLSLWHGPTGLPSPKMLLAQLRAAVVRADREGRTLAVAIAHVPLPSVEVTDSWHRRLAPKLKPGELIAVAGDGLLALVSIDPSDDEPMIRQRFADLMRGAIGVEVGRMSLAWYPRDGLRPEDLLARAVVREEETP